MECTALHLLWLLLAFTLTTQELVELNVSPSISAECGKQVTLQCNATSSQHGLLVKYMGWFHGDMSLCSVDSEEVVTTHHNHSLSDFHCEYEDGRLSLVFREVLPLESKHSNGYSCKLRSNRGMTNKVTAVELQECCRTAEGAVMSDEPSCSFSQVYPDGDVHWFHGSRRLPGGSGRYNTTKSVDPHGWLTIRSRLADHGGADSDVPYNCSLKSTTSGRYIASILVKSAEKVRDSRSGASGVGSGGLLRTVLSLSVSLIITLKYWI